MKTKLLSLAAIAVLFISCEKYLYNQSLGGTQSPIGEVNNSFTFSNPYGVSDATASVTDLTDGISTISYSVKLTDPRLTTLAGYITVANFNGTTLSGKIKAKITSEGMETVHKDGNLILVKYDAKVGDKYSLETDGHTITREVVSKSTEDDFYWGGMMIKTMEVEETGHSTPGVSKIKYVFNHKFGLVSAFIYTPDGGLMAADVFSDNNN